MTLFVAAGCGDRVETTSTNEQASTASGDEYAERDWHWLVDSTTENWFCGPSVPLSRCYIRGGNPAVWPIRYLLNGDLPFHIPAEACNANQTYCGYVYHFVQANNGSQVVGDGPFGHQNGIGGDEYWGFRCPDTDPFCRNTQAELFRDKLRPDNPSCDLDVNPHDCTILSWQLKSAFVEPRRGHKFTLFAKLADRGSRFTWPDGVTREAIIKGNMIVMNRDKNPVTFETDWDTPATPGRRGYEVVFRNTQDNRWCNGLIRPEWNWPDCPTYEHQVRLTDIALIPDPIGTRCDLTLNGTTQCVNADYVGYLNWSRDNNPAPGCNCCEVTNVREGRCNPDLTFGATFVIIKSRVGTWFVDRNLPSSQWRFVPWGEEIRFTLPKEPGIRKRTFEIAAVELPDGSTRYEAWQSRATPPGDHHPCNAPQNSPPAQYVHNLSEYPDRGSELIWFPFDPVNGEANDARARRHHVRWTRPWMPAQYPGGSMTWIHQRFDFVHPTTGELERWLTYGSRDNAICEYPNGTAKAVGRGVYAIELELE